jgi:uncharacterized membrane protein YdjX (TVP38/TMEM64 family)
VERHGWKMVAFTRLIPAFPFNLLNYAFGLTKIKFSHYAITTFFCMLPACIAFIVFSSSLLDLIRGKVSPGLIIGIGLIVLVSLIPLFYKKFKTRREADDNEVNKSGSSAAEATGAVSIPRGRSLGQILRRKFFALLTISALFALVVLMIRHYFYILDAYYYTAEFHVLFMINNIKGANLALLTEYFHAIRSVPAFFSALLLAYGVHLIWLPLSKPVLIPMASALYGPLLGGGVSFLALFPAGLLAYGLTRFFLGEVVPLIRKLRGKSEASVSFIWPWLYGIGFALPWLPVLFVAAVASFIKLSFKRMLVVLAVSLGVRILLVLLLPGFFT